MTIPLKQFIPVVVLGMFLGASSMAIAEPIGLVMDASAMQCTYTWGSGGPGSIGQISITKNGSSSLVVQELTLGSDRAIGGGDDTIIDMARITRGGFGATFSADVFAHGTNSYSIVGTYTIEDAGSHVVVAGDFNSDLVSLNGQSLFLGGNLSNDDGVLQPGGTSSWAFEGSPSATPNYINGLLGGADGGDGTVALNENRQYSTIASLLEFQFAGSFQDLDAFFNSAAQASKVADLKIQIVAAAPGTIGQSLADASRFPEPATLGLMALGALTILRHKRAFRAS